MTPEVVALFIACGALCVCAGVDIGLRLMRKSLDEAFNGWHAVLDALQENSERWSTLCQEIIDDKYAEASDDPA